MDQAGTAPASGKVHFGFKSRRDFSAGPCCLGTPGESPLQAYIPVQDKATCCDLLVVIYLVKAFSVASSVMRSTLYATPSPGPRRRSARRRPRSRGGVTVGATAPGTRLQ